LIPTCPFFSRVRKIETMRRLNGVLISNEGLQLLKSAKARRKLSISAIAEKAEVSISSAQYFFRPEKGNKVSWSCAVKISKILNLKADDLASLILKKTEMEAFETAERIIQDSMT
jgi:hypothetical protein